MVFTKYRAKPKEGVFSRARALFNITEGFIVLIILGTFLLLMPSSRTGEMSLIDALFVSVSASTVTGLSPIDLSSTLSHSGFVVILVLIQLGGLGIIFYFTLFQSVLSRKGEESYIGYDKDHLEDWYRHPKYMLFTVLFCLAIELLAASLLYLYWDYDFFTSFFHAASALNNAGAGCSRARTRPILRRA